MDSVLELSEKLAQLHTELAQALARRAQAGRDIERLRSEITSINRHISAGKRGGGRPVGATSAMSCQSKVLRLLADDPSRTWTTHEIARALDEVVGRVRFILPKLVDLGRARRVRRGLYRAQRPGEGPQFAMQETMNRERLMDCVRKAMGVDPHATWTAKRLVAEGFARNIQHGHKLLADLAVLGYVKRVKRGVFVHPDGEVRVARRRRQPPGTSCPDFLGRSAILGPRRGRIG